MTSPRGFPSGRELGTHVHRPHSHAPGVLAHGKGRQRSGALRARGVTVHRGTLKESPKTCFKTKERSSRHGAAERNLTGNHEVAGSVPGLAY